MPWWAVGYLVLFGLLTAGGAWADAIDRRPGAAVIGLLSGLVAGVLFAAYWLPAFAVVPSPLALVLVLAAAAWEVWAAAQDVRDVQAGPDPTPRGEALAIAAIVLAFMTPAYVVAGLAAVG